MKSIATPTLDFFWYSWLNFSHIYFHFHFLYGNWVVVYLLMPINWHVQLTRLLIHNYKNVIMFLANKFKKKLGKVRWMRTNVCSYEDNCLISIRKIWCSKFKNKSSIWFWTQDLVALSVTLGATMQVDGHISAKNHHVLLAM